MERQYQDTEEGRVCSICGFRSAPGLQICLNQSSGGACLAPLTQPGACDILRCVKREGEQFERYKSLVLGDRRSVRARARDNREVV